MIPGSTSCNYFSLSLTVFWDQEWRAKLRLWASKPIDYRSRHCIGLVSDIEWWIAAVVWWHYCAMTIWNRLDFVSGSDTLKMARYHATFFLENRLLKCEAMLQFLCLGTFLTFRCKAYFVVSALRFVDHCHQFAPLYTLLWAPLVFLLPVYRRFFPRVNW